MSTEEFKKELNIIFPDLILKSNYINTGTKVLVMDSYGIYYSVNPHSLLSNNYPAIRSSLNPTKALSLKVKNISPDITILGDYVNGHKKILVKDKLDIEYLIKPLHLLQGKRPSIQSAVNKNTAFSVLANSIHNFRYVYDNVIYHKNNIKINITCPIHGDFLQTPNEHLGGSGCPRCANNLKGWSYSLWEEKGLKSKNFDSFKLYIIKCWDNNEEFYKIGKTFVTTARRFKNKERLPYDWHIVKEIIGSARFISELEIQCHNKYRTHKYIPKLPFKGRNECFTTKIKSFI